MPVTRADVGRASSGSPQHRAPTMAPSVPAVVSARPRLTLVSKDAIAAAVEAIDAKLVPPSTMAEYPPVVDHGKRLFRYVAADGEEMVAIGIQDDLLTPHVRALWWELAEAIEAEARKRC